MVGHINTWLWEVKNNKMKKSLLIPDHLWLKALSWALILIICLQFDFKSDWLIEKEDFQTSNFRTLNLGSLWVFSVVTAVGVVPTCRLCCLDLASVVFEHAVFAKMPQNSGAAILIWVFSAFKPTTSKIVNFYLSALSCPKFTE